MFLKQTIYNIINIILLFSIVFVAIFLYQNISLIFTIIGTIIWIVICTMLLGFNMMWFNKQVFKESGKIYSPYNIQVIKTKNKGNIKEEEVNLLPVFKENYEVYDMDNKFNTILEGFLLIDGFSLQQVKLSVDEYNYGLYRNLKIGYNIYGVALIIEIQTLLSRMEPVIFYSTKLYNKMKNDFSIHQNYHDQLECGFLCYNIINEKEKLLQIEIIKQIDYQIGEKKLGIIIFNRNRLIYLTPESYEHNLNTGLPFFVTPKTIENSFEEQKEIIEDFIDLIKDILAITRDFGVD